MTASYMKDPEATLEWSFDWSPWLDDTETITAYVLTPNGLTVVSDSETDGVVTAWLSGGTADTSYRVECKITTSAGRIDERSLTIRVRER